MKDPREGAREDEEGQRLQAYNLTSRLRPQSSLRGKLSSSAEALGQE